MKVSGKVEGSKGRSRGKKVGVEVVSYLNKVLNGMALGLFSSLIIGLILKQLGTYLHLDILVRSATIAQVMMGPAIGLGVGMAISKEILVVIPSLVCGAIGAGTIGASGVVGVGEPVGALVAAVVGVEVGRIIKGKTRLDILLVPAAIIITGGVVGSFISPPIAKGMSDLGGFINHLTTLRPFTMGVLMSVSMGIILTLPISSAALSIALGLSGLASGAAIIGCTTHMVGFAVISYKDNDTGRFFAQLFGTSMLQISNIIKKPIVALPVVLTSAILGPLGTTFFKMKGDKIGGGMGSAGLVGQISTINEMGLGAIPKVLILHFLLPGLLSYIFYKMLKSKGRIVEGDLTI